MNKMKEVFRTFRPQKKIIQKYVAYYYLDIKEHNEVNQFECFPHFNNTISIYRSHIREKEGEMVFDRSAKPFQIFTPIRDEVLQVKQVGCVHRLVIVFFPLGIQQFYRNLNFGDFIIDFPFFESDEIDAMFATNQIEFLAEMLDQFLETRFKQFENTILEKSIDFLFNNCEDFSIAKLSETIGVSRQHLNRTFQLHLGISAKKFGEIVLFRQTVNKKLFDDTKDSFTELAYEFKFSDQSHLNKAYKLLTANTPKSFFKKGTILGEEDTFWHLNS